MKYNFIKAIEFMTIDKLSMRIDGTNIDVFFTDTYAYRNDNDDVIYAGDNYVIYDDTNDKGKYEIISFMELKDKYSNYQWTLKEM